MIPVEWHRAIIYRLNKLLVQTMAGDPFNFFLNAWKHANLWRAKCYAKARQGAELPGPLLVEQKHSSRVVSARSQIFYFCLSFLSSACQKCWAETFRQYRHRCAPGPTLNFNWLKMNRSAPTPLHLTPCLFRLLERPDSNFITSIQNVWKEFPIWILWKRGNALYQFEWCSLAAALHGNVTPVLSYTWQIKNRKFETSTELMQKSTFLV